MVNLRNHELSKNINLCIIKRRSRPRTRINPKIRKYGEKEGIYNVEQVYGKNGDGEEYGHKD